MSRAKRELGYEDAYNAFLRQLKDERDETSRDRAKRAHDDGGTPMERAADDAAAAQRVSDRGSDGRGAKQPKIQGNLEKGAQRIDPYLKGGDKTKERVEDAIAKFFFAEAVPMIKVESVFFGSC